MIDIGVFGTGHLGKIHLKCLAQLPEIYTVKGFFDPDADVREHVSSEFGISAFTSPQELLNEIHALDIVAPTPAHYDLIKMGLESGRHVFTEKPVTQTVAEARSVKALLEGNDLKLQVGHVERFNPAYQALAGQTLDPMFIEGHRLAMFNPRGTDVSVIHDLMIHDIDILVAVIPHDVHEIRASGVSIVSSQPDICNARIEFTNGAVANLTASRISLKNMRKLRLFQPDAYISMDFLEKKTDIVRLYDNATSNDQAFELELPGGSKWMAVSQPEAVPNNAIVEELRSFSEAIIENRQPDVPIDDALRSMEIAQGILNAIDESTDRARR